MTTTTLPATMNKSALKRMMEGAASLKKRYQRAVEKAGQVTEVAMHSLEVGAGAFGMGMLTGYNGTVPEVAGIPLDLGAGVALHLAAFSGLAGKSSSHLHGFADGCLAHYAVVMGTKAGIGLKEKQKPA